VCAQFFDDAPALASSCRVQRDRVGIGCQICQLCPQIVVLGFHLGREGAKYGIQEYVEIKYICLSGI
jgi:hypothetical protein